MTETEKMQQLHHRAVMGEELSPDEQTALQNWYDELDREEDLLINKNSRQSDVEGLREQLNGLLAELARTVSENERIARQNEALRRQNEALQRDVEKHLLEKAA